MHRYRDQSIYQALLSHEASIKTHNWVTIAAVAWFSPYVKWLLDDPVARSAGRE